MYGIDNTKKEALNRVAAKNVRRAQYERHEARLLAAQRRAKPRMRPAGEKLRTNWQ